MWFNVLVPDIKETFAKAMDAGCLEVQPITEMPEYGVSHASFFDPLVPLMVHQVHKVVSFEEGLNSGKNGQSSKGRGGAGCVAVPRLRQGAQAVQCSFLR